MAGSARKLTRILRRMIPFKTGRRMVAGPCSGWFWDFCLLGGEKWRVDVETGGGSEDASVGVGIEAEEPCAAAELSEGYVQGIEGAGVEGCSEFFDEFNGSIRGRIPGDGVAGPSAGV